MTVTRPRRPSDARRSSLDMMSELYPESPSDRKQRRTKYSGDQRDALEAVYSGEMYPSTTFKRELAMLLSLSNKQVQIWFQNRRSKSKTELAAAGLPPPSRRSIRTTRPPTTPISTLQRSYTDGALSSAGSDASPYNELVAPRPPPMNFPATSPLSYPNAHVYPFPLLPPHELTSALATIPDSSPLEPSTPFRIQPSSTPSITPRTPQPYPLHRTQSMPMPASCPPVRPIPRRHATSGLALHSSRPQMMSFQSFTSHHQLPAQSTLAARPATSGGVVSGAHVESPETPRPVTSAGLVTVAKLERLSTPSPLSEQQFLSSPITIRNRTSSASHASGHRSSPSFDMRSDAGIPSPVSADDLSPAPSEWSSGGSWTSGSYEFAGSQPNNAAAPPVPVTPTQAPALPPRTHFAPFSPTASTDSLSPQGTFPLHSPFSPPAYVPYGYQSGCAYDPSAHLPVEGGPYMLDSMHEFVSLPGDGMAYQHMVDVLANPSGYPALHDWTAGFASTFADIALADSSGSEPAFDMNLRSRMAAATAMEHSAARGY